jgi:hypothetical protein
MIRFILLFAGAAVLPLWSQDIGRTLCALEWPSITVAPPGTNTTSRVAMYVPARVTINGKTVVATYPICADLGPGLKLEVGANGRWLLSSTAPAVMPKMIVEKLSIPTTIPDNQAAWTYNLQKTPAVNTAILINYSGANFGETAFDSSLVTNPSRELTITLPARRPFTANDRLVLVYWTSE